MGELIELIIRAIEALTGKKRDGAPGPGWQAQQAEWERQRREWEAAQQRAAQPTPPIAQPPMMAPTARLSSGRQKRQKRMPPPSVPASARLLADDVIESAELVEVPSASPVAHRAQRSSVTAGSIAQWARPKTLRSQFILTEILKPPLSIRGQKV